MVPVLGSAQKPPLLTLQTPDEKRVEWQGAIVLGLSPTEQEHRGFELCCSGNGEPLRYQCVLSTTPKGKQLTLCTQGAARANIMFIELAQ